MITVDQSGPLDVEIISEELLGVDSDATPALLCHKGPAQGTLSPLCTWGISCLSLVPYGMKIGGFNARKEYHKAWIYLPKRNRTLIVLTDFDK